MSTRRSPATYTKELATAFLERIEQGEHVKRICSEPGMPCWRTIQIWRRKNPAFAASYLRVREASAESLEHEAIDEGDKATDHDSAVVARVRIDTLKWAAAKRSPRTYGDKLLHTGADGEGPIGVKLSLDYSRLTGHEMVQLRALIEKAMPRAEAPMIEGEAENDDGEA